jgi:GDP-4-dehydro-6-deoxy-D-mannose reductase
VSFSTVSQQILITGASGFAGSHLLDHLTRLGHDVVGWTRADVDLRDADGVRAGIGRLRPSQIYHCAGAPRVADSWQHTSETLENNVLTTHHLFDAVRRSGLTCRVLIPGSAMIYRGSNRAISEDDPVEPASPYGLSKLAQEQLGVRATQEDGVEVVLTRSFNHVGPRQEASFAAASMARQLALIESGRAEPLIRVGNLEARRDLTDVRDTVRAYALLMAHGRPAAPYNVCSGVAYAMSEVLDGLRARVPVDVRVEIDADRFRPNDPPLLVGNPARLRAETGWTPEIGFERMLDDLIDYWRRAVRNGA